MKYVITWTTRQNQTQELQERGLQVFGKWAPAPTVTFHQFLGRVDGRGGFAVVETDDMEQFAQDMATFSPFFEFSVYPCLEIQDSARIGGAAAQFLHSVS